MMYSLIGAKILKSIKFTLSLLAIILIPIVLSEIENVK